MNAIIAVMIFTFAWVGAVITLNVEDYYSQKKRWCFVFPEVLGHEICGRVGG
jgi:hypothetical protein